MPNYQQGKINKIWNNGYDKCYIGSTTQTLSDRMGNHRCHYRNWLKDSKKFCTVYDLFIEYGLENCKIELLEIFSCNSRSELEAREGHHQRENQCVNKNKCTGFTSDYHFKDPEYSKLYRETNKEHITDLKRAWSEKHKEPRLSKSKLYYEANREKILEQKKQYMREKLLNAFSEL